MPQTDDRPLLIIVGGPPASGKSTIAEWLAEEFRLPLLSRDMFKEAMMETLGSPDSDRSHELGAAAYAILAVLQQTLVKAGVGAVLESNFLRGVSEKDLAPILPKSRSVAIYCETSVAESLRRFEERAKNGDRHPGHHDTEPEKLEELEQDLHSGCYDPLDLDIPRLVVDTTGELTPDKTAIKQFVIDHTGGMANAAAPLQADIVPA
ncbi:MAG: ATP-binding protein [Thermomicrobiales bacterium]|nr:ATP-binding protein [Thermomicrobiales bacterium]